MRVYVLYNNKEYSGTVSKIFRGIRSDSYNSEYLEGSKTYYTGNIKTTALKSVEMEVSEGDFIIITGLSGSGKSTLLHILGTLDLPDDN